MRYKKQIEMFKRNLRLIDVFCMTSAFMLSIMRFYVNKINAEFLQVMRRTYYD